MTQQIENTDQKIRVFISYSHQDIKLVERLVSILEQEGIMVLWTKIVAGGTGYTEKLKIFIEHAHIFMPVITESSSARGWVHQEIGYAIALHVPVFPVTIGKLIPVGMLEFIHAIHLSDDDQILKEQICHNTLSALLKEDVLPALYQRAAKVEDRAALMKSYADKVTSLNKYGVVRQKGGLSSFHIPNKRIEHQDWIDRYIPDTRGLNHKELQLGERKALQQHTDKDGCKLIIKPQYAIEGKSSLAAKTRIKAMIDFLDTMPDDKVVIAIQTQKTSIESLTMVGDWFLAESVSFKDGDGFTNTFFTRNASEISTRIQIFDEELDELLEQLGWTTENSRVKTIERLKLINCSLEDLEKTRSADMVITADALSQIQEILKQ
ncbi:MAG: toll/interleukin-1 receptor domain-containing protein [Bacteroidales bacterium]